MRFVAIFALAAGVKALEVALTRLLSFITDHDMTYLVIATAMLGLGAAGTYLTIVRARIDPVGKVHGPKTKLSRA